MRLIARSTNRAADLANVITYADRSFTTASDQAAFAIYDASNLNPLFDFQWSRDGLAASKSMSEKLIERNDPRIRRVFINADWAPLRAPYGSDDTTTNPEVKAAYGDGQYVYTNPVWWAMGNN